MKSAIRLLIVSHTFPPQAAVGALRIARLSQFLPDHGVEPIILTVDDRSYLSVDYTVPLRDGLQVIRSRPYLTPLDWYRKAKKAVSRNPVAWNNGAAEVHWSPGVLSRHLSTLLQLPDRYWGWYFPALRSAERLLATEDIDALFSSGPPWISHLIAARIKKRHNIPWIADFRDPWADSFLEQGEPKWRRRIDAGFERHCVTAADLVICNTDRLRRRFETSYPELDRSHFQTLTNGFTDSERFPTSSVHTSQKTFLHLGSIYGDRRIDTFLQAIAELVQSGRLDPRTFSLIFQGATSAAFVSAAGNTVPQLLEKKCLEIRPRVSWQEARSTLWEADLLLLFQGNHELQVPAKFYEYLQTGIPIFAVTREGALTDVLAETEAGLSADPENIDQIKQRFLEVLCRPRRSPEFVEDCLAERFHFRALAGRLSESIARLAGQKTLPSAGWIAEKHGA